MAAKGTTQHTDNARVASIAVAFLDLSKTPSKTFVWLTFEPELRLHLQCLAGLKKS